jgi:hypothetical protein
MPSVQYVYVTLSTYAGSGESRPWLYRAVRNAEADTDDDAGTLGKRIVTNP